ncbi:hypothetical protein D3C80_1216160 [compost metagenome]
MYTFNAEHIGHLMRLGHNRRHPVLQNTIGERLRCNHRALNMQVNINQPGHQILTLGVNCLSGCERIRTKLADIEKTPVFYRNIRCLEPFIVTVVHFSVHYKLICNHHVCSL